MLKMKTTTITTTTTKTTTENNNNLIIERKEKTMKNKKERTGEQIVYDVINDIIRRVTNMLIEKYGAVKETDMVQKWETERKRKITASERIDCILQARRKIHETADPEIRAVISYLDIAEMEKVNCASVYDIIEETNIELKYWDIEFFEGCRELSDIIELIKKEVKSQYMEKTAPLDVYEAVKNREYKKGMIFLNDEEMNFLNVYRDEIREVIEKGDDEFTEEIQELIEGYAEGQAEDLIYYEEIGNAVAELLDTEEFAEALNWGSIKNSEEFTQRVRAAYYNLTINTIDTEKITAVLDEVTNK